MININTKQHDSLNHPVFLYMHATINMSATRANFQNICSGKKQSLLLMRQNALLGMPQNPLFCNYSLTIVNNLSKFHHYQNKCYHHHFVALLHARNVSGEEAVICNNPFIWKRVMLDNYISSSKLEHHEKKRPATLFHRNVSGGRRWLCLF